MKNQYNNEWPYKYHPHEGEFPPSVPGEYCIRNNDGEITYIGKTGNLELRTRKLMQNGKLTPESGGGTIECRHRSVTG